MKKTYLIIAFCIVAVIQLFVPAQMIFEQEQVLTKGRVYKFKTRPIDPNDPFRGKYVTLNYDIRSFKTKDSTWQRGDDVYVYIKDSLGFATLDTIAKYQLNRQTDYVVAEAQYFYKRTVYNNRPARLTFDLPFDRFYMEESKAKPAEDAIREARFDSVIKNVYSVVYVKDGKSVLEDVVIDGVPILEYIKKHQNE